MRNYTVIELAGAISGDIAGNRENHFSQISIDSRTLSDPSSIVFFAIEGKNRNGHAFIDELIRKEVKVFVVSNEYQNNSPDTSIS